VAHGQLGRADLIAGLLVGGRGEDLRVGQGTLPLRDLLGTLVGEQQAEVSAGLRDGRAQRAHEGRPAGAGLRQDQDPLAEGERTEQVDGPHERVARSVRSQQPPVAAGPR